MLKIDYPSYNFRIKKENNKSRIFDEVRRRWISLTPEEWVRQNFLQYLIHNKKYPASLIAVEKEIQLGELKKRFDIVVYRKNAPWVIIECKGPEVSITENTIHQVLRYNIPLRGSILVVTNGVQSFAAEMIEEKLYSLDHLPEWE